MIGRTGRDTARAGPAKLVWLGVLLSIGTSGTLAAQDTLGSTPGGMAPQQEGRPELADPQEADLDARAAEVASELRCPVCRNQSVLESNAELSREMQSIVRERLAAGETPEQVKAYFVSRYGEWILLKPTARGLNLVVYLLPFAALAAGAIVVRSRLRRWAAASGDASQPQPGAREVVGRDSPELGEENERWLLQALRER